MNHEKLGQCASQQTGKVVIGNLKKLLGESLNRSLQSPKEKPPGNSKKNKTPEPTKKITQLVPQKNVQGEYQQQFVKYQLRVKKLEKTKLFSCSKRKVSFRNRTALLKYERRRSRYTEYQCEYCHFLCEEESDLIKHNSNCKNNPNVFASNVDPAKPSDDYSEQPEKLKAYFNCCQQYFIGQNALFSHLHGKYAAKESSHCCPLYICNVCCTAYTKESAWNRHCSKKHNVTNCLDNFYICSCCSKRFYDIVQVLQHELACKDKIIPIGDNPAPPILKKVNVVKKDAYQCNICREFMDDLNSLLKHKVFHEEVKPDLSDDVFESPFNGINISVNLPTVDGSAKNLDAGGVANRTRSDLVTITIRDPNQKTPLKTYSKKVKINQPNSSRSSVEKSNVQELASTVNKKSDSNVASNQCKILNKDCVNVPKMLVPKKVTKFAKLKKDVLASINRSVANSVEKEVPVSVQSSTIATQTTVAPKNAVVGKLLPVKCLPFAQRKLGNAKKIVLQKPRTQQPPLKIFKKVATQSTTENSVIVLDDSGDDCSAQSEKPKINETIIDLSVDEEQKPRIFVKNLKDLMKAKDTKAEAQNKSSDSISCKLCMKRFKELTVYQSHLSCTCQLCKMKFCSFSRLKRHYDKKHYIAHVCVHCKRGFSTMHEFIAHGPCKSLLHDALMDPSKK